MPSNLFWPCDERRTLEYPVTIGTIEGKLRRAKQRKKMLGGIRKWLKVG